MIFRDEKKLAYYTENINPSNNCSLIIFEFKITVTKTKSVQMEYTENLLIQCSQLLSKVS